jgi:hypothetical protein
MAERLFVDTSALVALSIEEDERHLEAQAAWEHLKKQRIQCVTTNYIIAETITTVRGFADHARTVEFGERLFRSQVLRRIHIDERLEQAAWVLFKKYDDQDFSFTDCTSFAVMTTEKIKKAFTFDRDFQIAGFQVLP